MSMLVPKDRPKFLYDGDNKKAKVISRIIADHLDFGRIKPSFYPSGNFWVLHITGKTKNFVGLDKKCMDKFKRNGVTISGLFITPKEIVIWFE